ncbi:MAG TPA: tetratricopeptide repeat protein [Candidatus Aminicenantes bacterium]|nr:tetratricopeptide repeat protein [Candidatus Aminicenantes bacterium]
MKRKERAHLKEDPFQHFISTVLQWISHNRRKLVASAVVIASVLVVLAAVTLVRSHSYTRENKRLSEALEIRNNDNLTVEEKIERLSQLKAGRGLSAAAQLFLAGLYMEQGRVQDALDMMDDISSSHLDLINDQKTLLEAQILSASGQERQALDLFNQLLADNDTEVAKDYVLLLMARTQYKARQLDMARQTIERLLEEYPLTAFTGQAKELQSEISMQ